MANLDADQEWKQPLNWTGDDPDYYQSFNHEDSSFKLMNGAQIVEGRVNTFIAMIFIPGLLQHYHIRLLC